MASPLFLSSSGCLSPLKRLRSTGINGSKDTSCFGFSVANYSALSWAAAFEGANHSGFFSQLWKRTWLFRGEADAGFSRPLSSCDAPTSNTALCETADMPTYTNSPGALNCTDTYWAQTLTHDSVCAETRKNTFTKRNHKLLNSILQCSLAMPVLNTWVKKGKYRIHYWFLHAKLI